MSRAPRAAWRPDGAGTPFADHDGPLSPVSPTELGGGQGIALRVENAAA